jgi:hypothetical protein
MIVIGLLLLSQHSRRLKVQFSKNGGGWVALPMWATDRVGNVRCTSPAPRIMLVTTVSDHRLR